MDKTLTVNSLVEAGVVSQDIAGMYLNAPDEVLTDLSRHLKGNAFVPARPVADGAPAKTPTAAEADQAEAMELLKAKRANDAKVKCNMVAALKANSRCKFAPEALEKMDVDSLKTLSDSIGVPTANHAAAAGGVAPDAPKANTATVLPVAPAMPSFADGMAMLTGK